jgi:hypothetical protein
MEATMKAGRDPERGASILADAVRASPQDFPTITAEAEAALERKLATMAEEVLRDMPHLAGNPEAIAEEGIRRLKAEVDASKLPK